MPRKLRKAAKLPDWFSLARPLDHKLGPSEPIWVSGAEELSAAPLEMHLHRGLELGIVLAGSMELQCAGQDLMTSPGDVWLFSMWERHAWRTLEPGTRNVVLIFLPQVLQDIPLADLPWLSMFTASPDRRPRTANPQMREAILAIGRELQSETESRQPGWRTAIWVNLVRLMLVLVRNWRPPRSRRPSIGSPADHLGRIAPALDLVRPDLGTCASLEEAAAACNLSTSRFQHLFGHVMGLRYSEFCRRARLAVAAHLLISTDLPVEIVAQKAGFADGSHLHRRFSARYGCTPGEYRRRGRPSVHP